MGSYLLQEGTHPFIKEKKRSCFFSGGKRPFHCEQRKGAAGFVGREGKCAFPGETVAERLSKGNKHRLSKEPGGTTMRRRREIIRQRDWNYPKKKEKKKKKKKKKKKRKKKRKKKQKKNKKKKNRRQNRIGPPSGVPGTSASVIKDKKRPLKTTTKGRARMLKRQVAACPKKGEAHEGEARSRGKVPSQAGKG